MSGKLMHPIKIRLSRRAKHYSKHFMHPINLGGSCKFQLPIKYVINLKDVF